MLAVSNREDPRRGIVEDRGPAAENAGTDRADLRKWRSGVKTRTYLHVAVGCLAAVGHEARAQQRTMRPEDLFRLERITGIAWSPDGRRAALEIRHSRRWLDASIPTGVMAVVDATAGTLRVVSPPSMQHLGFYRARWSPDGRRLLFLSVDTNALIRPWVWTVGTDAPVQLTPLSVREGVGDPPLGVWTGSTHVAVIVDEPGQARAGPMHFAVTRGRNVAQAWRRAERGDSAAVMVAESLGPDTASASSRLISIDVRTGAARTLARGHLHRLSVSSDGTTLTYRSERPGFAAAPASTFFTPDAVGDAAYDRVNWGTHVHHVDARTGAVVPAPETQSPKDAVEPFGALRVENDTASGTTLWLVRAGKPELALWRGNEWVRDLRLGTAESIRYQAQDGRQLTGWILYPPGDRRADALPAVMIVYPGAEFTATPPGSLSAFREDFVHPQLFAALGYAVLLPSMPESERPLRDSALRALPNGVSPMLDTVVARGIVDSTRIAVYGQSAGGYATLGLITQTKRFRAAIASASYSNLVSLYGTFYGQFRYGDGGPPQRAQLLRMLQLERGYFGAGAPPWEVPDRYVGNSPITYVGQVDTPAMLIHGDSDFIPVQQAEEFFTALYRRDRRARLVRYAGEGHTISARANVLDMWTRVQSWLLELMPVKP